MDDLQSDPMGREAVLQRTAEGQRALVFDAAGLDRGERQLLSVLTGHTPLGVLDRLGLDTRRAAARLLARGLVSRVSS